MVDTIVIGGGLVGASAAYHLARAGAKTILFDRADPGRATDAGAGILLPVIYLPDADPPESWFRFSTLAFEYYRPLLGMLQADGETETGFAICGQLCVAVDGDEIEPFEEKLRFMRERQAKVGVPAAVTEISSQEARERFPLLAEVQRAFYLEDAARMDGRLMAGAFLWAGERHRLEIRPKGVDSLIVEGNSVRGVMSDGEAVHADRVIIAGGAWSASFAGQLGVPLGVEPQRGQIIHLRTSGYDTDRFPIVTAFHDHYLLTWEGGRVVAGATRETGSGFETRTSVEGIQEVLAEAVRVAPGLHDAEFVEIRVGLRPYTRDKMPVLGSVPGIDGIFLATGHGANGLQLGPYSGKLAADWATGQELEADISLLNVSRFAG